jgi:hypothetical protein
VQALHQNQEGGLIMIESVSRIVTLPVLYAPSIFETPIASRNFVETLWMQKSIIEHPAGVLVQIKHIDSGEYIMMQPDEIISWLRPEDMNDPVVQAELITDLASKGIEL